MPVDDSAYNLALSKLLPDGMRMAPTATAASATPATLAATAAAIPLSSALPFLSILFQGYNSFQADKSRQGRATQHFQDLSRNAQLRAQQAEHDKNFSVLKTFPNNYSPNYLNSEGNPEYFRYGSPEYQVMPGYANTELGKANSLNAQNEIDTARQLYLGDPQRQIEQAQGIDTFKGTPNFQDLFRNAQLQAQEKRTRENPFENSPYGNPNLYLDKNGNISWKNQLDPQYNPSLKTNQTGGTQGGNSNMDATSLQSMMSQYAPGYSAQNPPTLSTDGTNAVSVGQATFPANIQAPGVGVPGPASTQPTSGSLTQQQFIQQLMQAFGLGAGGSLVNSAIGATGAAVGGGTLGGAVGAGVGQVGNQGLDWISKLFGGQTKAPATAGSNTKTFAPSHTASPTNTSTVSSKFNPSNSFSPSNTNTNTNTINVAPATVPNSYQFNNGVPPLQSSQGNQGGFWNNMNPQPPTTGVNDNTWGTPPPTGSSTGSGPDTFNQLMQMFGIQNPAQAGLGAGILGIGSLFDKDVNLPDFWQDRGVQDLSNWGNSANHPMDPNVEASIQRSMDIQNEQQLRNLRDVYKNLRPGTDYTTDTNYQRDLGNLNRQMALNSGDAKAGAQFKSNDQQIGIKSNLAEGSVGQGRIQGLFDTQRNTNRNKLFGDLGSSFINSSLQKPPVYNTQQINMPKTTP